MTDAIVFCGAFSPPFLFWLLCTSPTDRRLHHPARNALAIEEEDEKEEEEEAEEAAAAAADASLEDDPDVRAACARIAAVKMKKAPPA